MGTSRMEIDWDPYIHAVRQAKSVEIKGRVVKVVGLIAEAQGLGLSIGSICRIENDQGQTILSEVVGFRDNRVLLMPYGDTMGIRPGSRVALVDKNPKAGVGGEYLGRVIDGMGHPIDGLGPIHWDAEYPLYGTPINPMARNPIREAMDVGVRAINGMVTLGRGQRVAIMAGSGVGKSVLMGMMTRHTEADVTIIGMIGERGREVKDFVENNLGEEGIKNAVVIAATSDSPPLVRMRGAYLSTAMAEYFRDQGKNVLLIMDSITRFAMSSRDVGLAAGEPPTTRGYTPSFFVKIPVLLERAGTVKGKGSITGIYTVLVEGDDLNDPVGDTVRSIVDGHIVLSRKLANKGHYPAIDVLESVSRVMRDVSEANHMKARDGLIDIMSSYRSAEDMITIGAYVDGSDPVIDKAKRIMPKINAFLRQETTRKAPMAMSISELVGLYGMK